MKVSSPRSGISRRQFIATTAAAIAAPTFIPASALGADGRPAPSERITMGVVGWGMQGPSNTGEFLQQSDCQVVAACDLDKNRLQAAADTINSHYGNKDCKTYHDFRELMARTDIDAVMLAVPDHWHLLVAREAARNKKDIYGEKPLARTITEQQAIVKAVQENNRIWQTGSWQRSQRNFRKACQIVRNGLIGKVTHVDVGLPSGHTDFGRTRDALMRKVAQLPEKISSPAQIQLGSAAWDLAVSQPPSELDYEMWIGPSRMEPYIQARVHENWRWNYNIGGGQLLDWIGHHMDIAHWGLGFDNSGPSEIEGTGQFPPADAVWNTCTSYRINLQYPQDITITVGGGQQDIRMGTKWVGTEGWVYVDRGGFDASNKEWTEMRELPEDQQKVKLYVSNNHYRNFLDCVKSRKPTIAPVETAHHSAIPGHLGLISMLTRHKIKWDVEKQQIIGDADASKLLTRTYREPWKMV